VSRIDALATALGRHPIFCDLDDDALKHIVETAAEIHVERGETLYTSGETATQVFVILSGAIQVEYPRSGETRGPVAAILAAPSFLGEAQVIAGKPWSGTGVAITRVLALGLSKKNFVALISRYLALTRRLYLELSHRFLGAIETWRYEPSLKPAESCARYLTCLLQVFEDVEDDHDGRTIPIRQVELAQAVGVRPETVNRLLKAWQKAGLVELSNHGLAVVDREGVAALVVGPTDAPLIRVCSVPDAVEEPE
jgi:CRP/FNR family cyclic AMP-dependent transcriptional regulator